MNDGPQPAIYRGYVVHRRLRPVTHDLRYRVAYLLLDVDRISETARGLRFFSYNRPNLFSIRDRDYGPRDGTTIPDHAAGLVASAGLSGTVSRTMLLTIPRIAGYAFNPLSVYYALDGDDAVRLVVYEVSNTFGQRRSYVLPVGDGDGVRFRQGCEKRLYVSPFNEAGGRYAFTGIAPGERVRLSVGLSDASGPVMSAHLVGARSDLDDRELASVALRYPLLTWKVTGGIHFEALRLWLKGLRVARRPPGPANAVTRLPTSVEMERR